MPAHPSWPARHTGTANQAGNVRRQNVRRDRERWALFLFVSTAGIANHTRTARAMFRWRYSQRYSHPFSVLPSRSAEKPVWVEAVKAGAPPAYIASRQL